MSKTFRIEVDCANCANLVEDAAKKVSGVKELFLYDPEDESGL